jgi:hypothetical protein
MFQGQLLGGRVKEALQMAPGDRAKEEASRDSAAADLQLQQNCSSCCSSNSSNFGMCQGQLLGGQGEGGLQNVTRRQAKE